MRDGARARTVVPIPGVESTVTSPFTSLSRSCMLINPRPSVLSGPAIEAAAVVRHLQLHLVALSPQRHPAVPGAGMLHDIRHGFLNNRNKVIATSLSRFVDTFSWTYSIVIP